MLLISPSVQGAHLIRAATSVSATSVPRLCVDQSVPEAVDHRRAIHYRPCDPQPTTVAYTAVSMLCMGVLSGLVGGHWKSRSVRSVSDWQHMARAEQQYIFASHFTLRARSSCESACLTSPCCNAAQTWSLKRPGTSSSSRELTPFERHSDIVSMTGFGLRQYFSSPVASAV